MIMKNTVVYLFSTILIITHSFAAEFPLNKTKNNLFLAPSSKISIHLLLEEIREIYKNVSDVATMDGAELIPAGILDIPEIAYYIGADSDSQVHKRLDKLNIAYVREGDRISAFLSDEQFNWVFYQSNSWTGDSTSESNAITGTAVFIESETDSLKHTVNKELIGKEAVDQELLRFNNIFTEFLKTTKLDLNSNDAYKIWLKNLPDIVKKRLLRNPVKVENILISVFSNYLNRLVKMQVDDKIINLIKDVQTLFIYKLTTNFGAAGRLEDMKAFIQKRVDFQISELDSALKEYLNEVEKATLSLKEIEKTLKAKKKLVDEGLLGIISEMVEYFCLTHNNKFKFSEFEKSLTSTKDEFLAEEITFEQSVFGSNFLKWWESRKMLSAQAGVSEDDIQQEKDDFIKKIDDNLELIKKNLQEICNKDNFSDSQIEPSSFLFEEVKSQEEILKSLMDIKREVANTDYQKLGVSLANFEYTWPAMYNLKSPEVKKIIETIKKDGGKNPLKFSIMKQVRNRIIPDTYRIFYKNLLFDFYLSEIHINNWELLFSDIKANKFSDKLMPMIKKQLPQYYYDYENYEQFSEDERTNFKKIVMRILNEQIFNHNFLDGMTGKEISNSEGCKERFRQLKDSQVLSVSQASDKISVKPEGKINYFQKQAMQWLNGAFISDVILDKYIDSKKGVTFLDKNILLKQQEVVGDYFFIKEKSIQAAYDLIAKRLQIKSDYLTLFQLMKMSEYLYKNIYSGRETLTFKRNLVEKKIKAVIRTNFSKEPRILRSLNRQIPKLVTVIEKTDWSKEPAVDDFIAFSKWAKKSLFLDDLTNNQDKLLEDCKELRRGFNQQYINDKAMINLVAPIPEMMQGYERVAVLSERRYMSTSDKEVISDETVLKEKTKIKKSLQQLLKDAELNKDDQTKEIINSIYDIKKNEFKISLFKDFIEEKISPTKKFKAVATLRFFKTIIDEKDSSMIELLENISEIIQKEELLKAEQVFKERDVYPENSILIVENDLEISTYNERRDRFIVDGQQRLKGIVVLEGSVGSHWLQFPKTENILVFYPNQQLSGIPVRNKKFSSLFKYLNKEDNIVVSGRSLIFNPGENEIQQAEGMKRILRDRFEYMFNKIKAPLPYNLKVACNINPYKTQLDIHNIDIEELTHLDVASVGLFRTEFLFDYGWFSGEEHENIYKNSADSSDLDITIRTFDRDFDKTLQSIKNYYVFSGKEISSAEDNNPDSLGIRFALKEGKDIFKKQLKAIFKAQLKSNKRNIKIMFPMIESSKQFDQVMAVVSEVKEDILREIEELEVSNAEILTQKFRVKSADEALKIMNSTKLGTMIETKSAIDDIKNIVANENVDFVSVGTNDLTKFLISDMKKEELDGKIISRGDPKYSKHFAELEPVVLKAVMNVVYASIQTGKPVSICGEMASDPSFICFLAGVLSDQQLEAFFDLYTPSVSIGVVAKTKEMFRKVLMVPEIKAKARQALVHYYGGLDIKPSKNLFENEEDNQENNFRVASAIAKKLTYEQHQKLLREDLRQVVSLVYQQIDKEVGEQRPGRIKQGPVSISS